MFSLLSLFLGGGLPRVPCGLVELCGFMAKVTKVDEKASDEEVALIRDYRYIVNDWRVIRFDCKHS